MADNSLPSRNRERTTFMVQFMVLFAIVISMLSIRGRLRKVLFVKEMFQAHSFCRDLISLEVASMLAVLSICPTSVKVGRKHGMVRTNCSSLLPMSDCM